MKILDASYHRNGVGGNGFYVAIFEDPKFGEMLGVFFPERDSEGNPKPSMNTAIFSMEGLKESNIQFGQNSWPGDHYADVLNDAVAFQNAEWDKQFAPKKEKKEAASKIDPSDIPPEWP